MVATICAGNVKMLKKLESTRSALTKTPVNMEKKLSNPICNTQLDNKKPPTSR